MKAWVAPGTEVARISDAVQRQCKHIANKTSIKFGKCESVLLISSVIELWLVLNLHLF